MNETSNAAVNKFLHHLKNQVDNAVEIEIKEIRANLRHKILAREWHVRCYTSVHEASWSYVVIFPRGWNDFSEDHILEFLDVMNFPIREYDSGPGRGFSDGVRIFKRASGRWIARYNAGLDI